MKMLISFRKFSKCYFYTTRHLHTTCIFNAGRYWRLRQGLEVHGHANSPLTEIPDWSYADGRPAPVPYGIARRRQEMTDFTKKAVSLMGEMQEARDMLKTKQQQDKIELEEKLKQRFKPRTPNRANRTGDV